MRSSRGWVDHMEQEDGLAHKTTLVREFLQQNPPIRFHFTPTYSSLLN